MVVVAVRRGDRPQPWPASHRQPRPEKAGLTWARHAFSCPCSPACSLPLPAFSCCARHSSHAYLYALCNHSPFMLTASGWAFSLSLLSFCTLSHAVETGETGTGWQEENSAHNTRTPRRLMSPYNFTPKKALQAKRHEGRHCQLAWLPSKASLKRKLAGLGQASVISDQSAVKAKKACLPLYFPVSRLASSHAA